MMADSSRLKLSIRKGLQTKVSRRWVYDVQHNQITQNLIMGDSPLFNLAAGISSSVQTEPQDDEDDVQEESQGV